MKTCSRCKQEKQDSEFNKRKSGKKEILSAFCRECNKLYLKNHYQKNKKYYVEKKQRWTNKYKDWFKKLKSTLKCEQCGENHPACLDFHHKNSKEKISEISKMFATRKSKEKILKEIDKCIVLCSNCHRKLHHKS